jgi:imidazolonepropionase
MHKDKEKWNFRTFFLRFATFGPTYPIQLVTIIKNIKRLTGITFKSTEKLSGTEMAELRSIDDAWLIIEDDIISGFGPMGSFKNDTVADSVIDAAGKLVMPAFCDSHSHIVYAGSREREFVDKLRGLSYEEIARRGGGILNSAALLHNTSEDELFEQSVKRVFDVIATGTGALEIKSGYGLNTNDELKMLRVIKRIREVAPVEIRSTFLGAHALPAEFRSDRDAYIDILINEMIPAVASEELADFIDVFCDRGFFTPDETEQILMAGIKYGLRAKLHANELDFSGGIEVGVKYGALSVDHLEYTGDSQIELLKGSDTMPVILPGSAFFLALENPPARKMIDTGLPLAIASDYNPGSSPSGNMKLAMSLASVGMKLLPSETINAATINGAYAMGISETHGSICEGKTANLIITTDIPGEDYFIYSFGSTLIETVILRGKIAFKKQENIIHL